MTEPAGYFVDTKDETGDVFICKSCVDENGLSTSQPLDVASFAFLPMRCAIHLLGGEARDYKHG
jgi:hypothetical protein